MTPAKRRPGGSRVRWGVLGVASIATAKVIPAMQRCASARVTAIASRRAAKARRAAASLGIPRAFGSYEALIADPDIDAVYIPLPNHLHVEWALRAAAAGKHVLCEKPIGLRARDVATLIRARDQHGVLIQEAFMYRSQPAWRKAIALIRRGRIGAPRAVVGVFSYFNVDAADIVNVRAWGGGGLYDIGCYLVNSARWIFGGEPVRVSGAIDRDPASGIDRLTSMVLAFKDGHAIGVCGTQMARDQRVTVFGTRGTLEFRMPFSLPPDQPGTIWIDDAPVAVAPSNQYTIQGEEFSRAILRRLPAPYPLEDSLRNMKVIDAVFDAARK